jgi:putative oxidoreductase
MLHILHPFLPYALLFLRIIVAVVFFSSGMSHLRKPSNRVSELPHSLTILLGMVEIIAPIMIAVGIYVQIVAMMLIIIMAGAISIKIFVRNVGFYSSDSLGWHYDTLLLCANFVFLAGGGKLVLIG